VPHVVSDAELPSTATLSGLQFNISGIIGPALDIGAGFNSIRIDILEPKLFPIGDAVGAINFRHLSMISLLFILLVRVGGRVAEVSVVTLPSSKNVKRRERGRAHATPTLRRAPVGALMRNAVQPSLERHSPFYQIARKVPNLVVKFKIICRQKFSQIFGVSCLRGKRFA
jgi:hypothetical protein